MYAHASLMCISSVICLYHAHIHGIRASLIVTERVHTHVYVSCETRDEIQADQNITFEQAVAIALPLEEAALGGAPSSKPYNFS